MTVPHDLWLFYAVAIALIVAAIAFLQPGKPEDHR